MWRWAHTPQAIPIPLTPAPRTRAGVCLRLFVELVGFRTLWRASPATWCGCVLLHYGLLFTLVLHLRFLWPRTPLWIVPLIPYGTYASLALTGGLLVLLARRLLVARVRYISVPSDYLWLLLLLCIVVSGAVLKHIWPVDAYQVGRFLRAALRIDTVALPGGMALWLHLGAVLLLAALYPVGKLLHGPGVLFAPTLNARAP